AQRVQQTLDVEPDLDDRPDAVSLAGCEPTIAFENVTFGYDAEYPVLRDVSFTVPAGTHVGIVGPSGAGKSSLMGLFLRLYAPNSGRLTVGGVDIQQAQLATLIEQCAIVPQTAFLYEGTIRENVMYGNPKASEDDLDRALTESGVAEFAERFPEGIDTWIGEGTMLSGGEKQRICIARALIRNPRFMVFDEATASLDSETESSILESLHELVRGRTAVSIAHRLKAVRRCDHIVVLQAGSVVQQGTHEDLVKTPGCYQDMWQEQTAHALIARGGDDDA
ncbi:MAG: ABC transporter ATP-binding protein/permease, partial [Nitrospirae bacterium]|nr:ABC transporter ATP-binding protein/permease [Fimbriimonadaceae bacterium]